jgi:hypothetical protein
MPVRHSRRARVDFCLDAVRHGRWSPEGTGAEASGNLPRVRGANAREVRAQGHLALVYWHWSHAGTRHCDPWWENETDWHRRWRSYFPEAEREIVHFDDVGEKHVADVKTSRGMVIEFQHSAMPPDELRARETFYGR